MGSDERIWLWNVAITAKYPGFDYVYLAVDRLELLLLQKSGDDRVKSYFYKGWTSDHYISNLFAFAPDCSTLDCVLDAPGSLHAITVASLGGIYTMLIDVYDCNGGKVSWTVLL